MEKNYYLLKDNKQLFTLLAAMLLGFASYAQSTVSGVVRSEGDNETIPGVSVLVKGTTRGTVTDLDGIFQVDAAAGEVLSISYIGYTTQEITIQSGQTQYEITLASSMSDLTEVIVVGYGSQLKKEITGAVQTIEGDDLMDIPAPQIAQKLQGQLAGVQINQTTGKPGQGMNVRIRGQLSVSAGSDPLYVVDGFPITGDIATLNPDEIQDITILKDAASTSLYGSRAANGVVLITTKRGKPGQSSVSLNVYTGLQNVPHYNRLEMMDAVEFAQFKKEYYEDEGKPVPNMFQDPSSYQGQTQDWYDALLQTAPISNYNLTINSNTEKMRTSVVAGYFDQQGVVLNTDYERFSLRINSDYTASDKISMGFNIAPQYVRDNTPRTDGIRGTGILFNALHTWPNMPIYDEEGELTSFNRFPSETGNIFAYPNYVRSALEITNETKQTNLLSNAYVQYKPIEGLVVKSTINAEIRNSKFFNFTPSTVSAGINIALPAVASSVRDHFNDFSWLNENTATYTKSINDHNFQILGGFTNQKFRRERSRVAADTYADDRLPTIQGAININRGGTTSDVQEWSLTSFLSRLTYNFKGKYLMTAAIRADGSSRFGAENRWGIFPSVSAGWVLSDERFLNTSEQVSFAKIRGSYGVTGNNNIGNYTQYALVSNTQNHVFDNTVVPGAAITSLSNPFLGWETTRQFDIGLDLGLYDDRIQFIYDFYTKNTSNLLYNVQIPQEAGFGSFTDNIGEIKFWGHEFSITSRNTQGRLLWTTNANISFNRNEVIALADGIDRVYGYAHITQVGQPFGQFYGLNKLGNYMDQEDLDNSPKVPGRSTVGSIKLEDVNGDGIISIGGDNDDRTIIGNPFPDFTYGITNNFKYGKWDLNIIASGSQGHQLYMRHLYSTANLDGVFNMVQKATDRFRSPEDPGEGIFGTTVGGGNVTGIERDWANSNFVWDASFFSIKNITLGYDIGKIANVVKSARLYASVQNVYIFTPYWGGPNPEVSQQDNGDGDGGNLSPGVDLTGYPIPRTFTIGANITF